jgi:hypothetical protein
VPDDKGNFLPGGFSVRGQGGEVLDGHRLVTELRNWSMAVEEADGNRMKVRITVQKHEPVDAYTWEHAPDDGLTLEAKFGRKTMRGDARIVGRIPGVVIEADVEVV